MNHNGSGITYTEPKPEHFTDNEDFEFSWKEWASEYPHLAGKALTKRED